MKNNSIVDSIKANARVFSRLNKFEELIDEFVVLLDDEINPRTKEKVSSVESRFYVISPRFAEWDPEKQEMKKNIEDPYSVFISLYDDYGKLRPLVRFLTDDMIDIFRVLREINNDSVTKCLNLALFEYECRFTGEGCLVDLSDSRFIKALRDAIDKVMEEYNIFGKSEFSRQDVISFYEIVSKLK